jgi:co-chaperonin GroES (HSP10)
MNEYASLPEGESAYDNHVIVAMKKLQKTTAGGIELPRALETEYGKGLVLSVGHGVERVKIGDVIRWKDTVTYLGNDKIVHNDAAVFINKDERIVAVKREMIISVWRGSQT